MTLLAFLPDLVRHMTSRFVSQFCGLLLLAAVGLKATGWYSAGGVSGYFSPGLMLAATELEAALGLWLVSGFSPRAARLSGIAVFGALAAVSLYLGLVGQRSCGCFGRVSVSPWGSLALDVGCLAALVAFPPPSRPAGDLNHPQARGWAVATFILIALSASTWFTLDRTGLLPVIRGEWLVADPVEADLGDGLAGGRGVMLVEIVNRSGQDVRLIGGTASCACVATDSLPLTIPAGGRQSIEVGVRFSGSPGVFKHEYMLFTDFARQPVVAGRVTGRVRAVTE